MELIVSRLLNLQCTHLPKLEAHLYLPVFLVGRKESKVAV